MTVSDVSISYATPKPARRYSKFGIAALVLGLLHLFSAALLILITVGAVGAVQKMDEMMPIVLVVIAGGAAVLAIATIGVALLWLLGLILAAIGFFRSRRLCWWSKAALAIHTILPIAIIGLWALGYLRR
jgi:hypothetical protein